MMLKRHWSDDPPRVGHDNKVMWRLFSRKGLEHVGPPEAACLLGLLGISRHTLQSGMQSDYHDHENDEQIYYFIKGNGSMLIDGERYPVKPGDAVHLPPKTMHQLINNSDSDIEHLLIGAIVKA